MRIQSISTNQQQTSFQAMKLPKLRTRTRMKPKIAPETQERNRNYTQAILFALAFCAAAMTKYFIDLCNGKHRSKPAVEARVEQPAKQTDANVYQLK